jgi:transposase
MLSGDSRSDEKKTLEHPKADEIERIKFQCQLIRYEDCQKRPIIYLDESGFAVDDPRTHGYSTRGKPCYGKKDWHCKGRVNAIGPIHNFEFITVDLWDCNINSDVFFTWLTKSLIPKLPENSVVVMDNASFHKRQDMLEALTEKGHTPFFLPPYSPDLNPIEKKWAQAKKIRKKFLCDPFSLFANFYDFL